jgi:hypothetical protein
MAQSPKFGFNAGISLANMEYKAGDEKDKTDYRVGLNMGVVIDIPVGSNLSIQPGINFIQKGVKEKETDENFIAEMSTRINYLEVPLNLIYKAPLKKGHFFFGAGPSAAYALNGKAEYKYTDTDLNETETEEEKFNFGNKDDDDLKAFELGLNIVGGFQLKSGIIIAINYNRSINNLLPGNVENASLRNSYFGFKIGYMFGRQNK